MSSPFAGLGIRPELANRLKQKGIAMPTPVQERTIPVLLAGKDAISQAQTGTGKTLAFVLPILEIVDTAVPQVQALIVTPTRELALQITDEIRSLAPVVDAGVMAVYGGQDVEAQIHKLRKGGSAQIVVATPGRLLDHVRRETIDLTHVSMLVLDEADQMLHMGFLNEVEEIIRHTPANRQTMLFSATMPGPVRKLAAGYLRNPEDIRVEGKKVTLEGTRQIVVETTDRAKPDTLLQLLEQYRPFLGVIFCRTKIRAKKLTEQLLAEGLNVDELHGDLTQSKREQVMRRFRNADLQLLVATDVAARGLDVEGVTHVFNYDIPHDAESYIHRIGRTGRAGQKGMAITLAAPRDRMYLEQIESGIGSLLERRRMGVRDADAREEGVAPAGRPRTGRDARARSGGAEPRGRAPGRRGDGRHAAGAGTRGGAARPAAAGAGARGGGARPADAGAGERGGGARPAAAGAGTRGGGARPAAAGAGTRGGGARPAAAGAGARGGGARPAAAGAGTRGGAARPAAAGAGARGGGARPADAGAGARGGAARPAAAGAGERGGGARPAAGAREGGSERYAERRGKPKPEPAGRRGGGRKR